MVNEIKLDKPSAILPTTTPATKAKKDPSTQAEDGIQISSHLDYMAHMIQAEENAAASRAQRFEAIKTQINNNSYRVDFNALTNKLLKIFNLA